MYLSESNRWNAELVFPIQHALHISPKNVGELGKRVSQIIVGELIKRRSEHAAGQ